MLKSDWLKNVNFNQVNSPHPYFDSVGDISLGPKDIYIALHMCSLVLNR